LEDEEVEFLPGHISQLSKKIPKALPLDQEEVKKNTGGTSGVDEIDPNLTYPIVLNATLIQQPQPLWKDWIPIIVSILVVILGGLITYYVNIMIERKKRQYELKRDTYFEALSNLQKLQKVSFDTRTFIVLNITYLTYHVRIWESMILQRKDSSSGQESYPSRFL